MLTIHKLTLEPTDVTVIQTAGIVKTLHVEPTYTEEFMNQGLGTVVSRRETIEAERINVWCLVNTEVMQKTNFYVVGTGHLVLPRKHYIGTAPMPSGLVWHVFTDESNF